MSDGGARRGRWRGAIATAVAFASVFVACGGRSTLDAGFGGAAGSVGASGAGAQAAAAGTIGLGGASGTGGFGGVGVGGAAGSSLGAGGSAAECFPLPRVDCQSCHCSRCPAEWRTCQENRGCADIMDCVAATGCTGGSCYPNGFCGAVIDSYGGIGSPSNILALQLDTCARGSGCICSGGAGGGAGSFGVGASGGTDCRSLQLDPCTSCLCHSCTTEWQVCVSNARCADLVECYLASACVRSNTCPTVCGDELKAASPEENRMAQSFYNCTLNSGCPCSLGVGGAAGFGGTAGFGGAAGSAGALCPDCIRANCPIVLACGNRQGCSQSLTCATLACYEAGRWNAECVLSCFADDIMLGQEMLAGLECMTGTCRRWCVAP